MTDFWFATACNWPRIHDPAAVQQILDQYRFDWDLLVEIATDDEGRSRLRIEGDGWPGAWVKSPDYSPDDEPDFPTDGVKEFESLLSRIAPHLAEPLIVQAIGFNQGRFPLSACEWQVHPGWQTIAKTEFSQVGNASQAVDAPLTVYRIPA